MKLYKVYCAGVLNGNVEMVSTLSKFDVKSDNDAYDVGEPIMSHMISKHPGIIELNWYVTNNLKDPVYYGIEKSDELPEGLLGYSGFSHTNKSPYTHKMPDVDQVDLVVYGSTPYGNE